MTIAESNLPHEIKIRLSWLQGVCCALEPDPEVAYGAGVITHVCDCMRLRDYTSAGVHLNWLVGYLTTLCPSNMVEQVQGVIGEIAENNKDPEDVERLKQAIRAGSVEWESLKEAWNCTNRKMPVVGEAGDCSDGLRVIDLRPLDSGDQPCPGVTPFLAKYHGETTVCTRCEKPMMFLEKSGWVHWEERNAVPPVEMEAESDNTETKAQINFREFL